MAARPVVLLARSAPLPALAEADADADADIVRSRVTVQVPRVMDSRRLPGSRVDR